MSMYITELGKHKFACGLFWQSLSRPRELAREARELARKIECDLIVLRKEYATAQAGYAHGSAGLRGTVYSLGAAVAHKLAQGATYDGENQPVHNWLGAFRLPDGMWAYLAMRDANFLPDGDFAGTREEVFERLHSDYGLGGWNMVIGDAELEDYGFHNFTARRIDELLESGKNGQIKVQAAWALRTLQAEMPLRRVALAGGLLLLAGGGALIGFKQYRAQQEQAERDAAMALVQAQLQQERNVVASHPWRKQPVPQALAQACVAHLAHLHPGGWVLSDYVCTAREVRYAWSRQESSAALLLAQVPQARIGLDGNSASHTVALDLPTGRDEALLANGAALQPVQSRLQLMRVEAKFSEPPAPAAPPANADGTPGPAFVPAWRTYRYDINSLAWSPLELAAILDQPGVRLEKIAYRGGIWSIQGVIYEK